VYDSGVLARAQGVLDEFVEAVLATSVMPLTGASRW
jgi:hypothetical protein